MFFMQFPFYLCPVLVSISTLFLCLPFSPAFPPYTVSVDLHHCHCIILFSLPPVPSACPFFSDFVLFLILSLFFSTDGFLSTWQHFCLLLCSTVCVCLSTVCFNTFLLAYPSVHSDKQTKAILAVAITEKSLLRL